MSEYRVSGELYEIDGKGLAGDAKIADITVTLFAKDEDEAGEASSTLFNPEYFYLLINDMEKA